MTRTENSSHKDALVAIISEIERSEGCCIRSVGFYAKELGVNRKEASGLLQELACEKRIIIKTQWVEGVKRMRINIKESI